MLPVFLLLLGLSSDSDSDVASPSIHARASDQATASPRARSRVAGSGVAVAGFWGCVSFVGLRVTARQTPPSMILALWQLPRFARCGIWGYGNFLGFRVAGIGVVAETGLPQPPKAQRAEKNALWAPRLDCHNPNLRNASEPEIAITPVSIPRPNAPIVRPGAESMATFTRPSRVVAFTSGETRRTWPAATRHRAKWPARAHPRSG